jgi:hypothetical protein
MVRGLRIWGALGAAVMLMAPVLAWGAGRPGLAVSPAFQSVSVAADVPSVQYEVQLINRNPVDQNFRLSRVDFKALDEQGGVAFLGTSTSELEHKYGLASWMSLEKDAVFVPAGKSAKVLVTINNRPDLAPGGHYGAVLATAVDDLGRPTGDQVGVKQVLSSLVLVTKEGGAERDLKLVSQTAEAGWSRLPSAATLRFQNLGNVHVVPRGIVEVKDTAGRVVVRGAINEESGNILPESYRQYKTPLRQIAPALLPGKYQMVTTYRYDGTDATSVFVTSFWYAGSLLVWGIGLAAVAAVAGLGWWLFGRPRKQRRKV